MSEFDVPGMDLTPEKATPKVVKANTGNGDTKKQKWFTIMIDEVEGKPNYEFVGVNGKGYQIMRGEPVSVPEEVVEALRNAVETFYVETRHPDDPARKLLVPKKRSAVPWRMV